jgi:predicted transcriptional regulator
MKKSTAEIIKERRRRASVSQGELGREIGRTQTWVSLLERGMIVPKPETIQRIFGAIVHCSTVKRIVQRAKSDVERKVLTQIHAERHAGNTIR